MFLAHEKIYFLFRILTPGILQTKQTHVHKICFLRIGHGMIPFNIRTYLRTTLYTNTCYIRCSTLTIQFILTCFLFLKRFTKMGTILLKLQGNARTQAEL